jgi:hypothetical protein
MDAHIPMELRYYLAVRDQNIDDPVDVDDFVARVNGDLVNNAANLASRSIVLLVDKLDGRISASVDGHGQTLVESGQALVQEVLKAARTTSMDLARNAARMRLRIATALSLSRETNLYLSRERPWELVASDPERARSVLTAAILTSYAVAVAIGDLIPDWLERFREAGLSKEMDDAIFSQAWPMARFSSLSGRYVPLIPRLDTGTARQMIGPKLSPAHVEVEGVQRRDWGEFREAGMVYAANTILQWFGWEIVASYDDKSGKLLEVFPARADHRGFTAESNARGIERLTLWMEKASPALLAEVHHEPPTEPPMVVDARR